MGAPRPACADASAGRAFAHNFQRFASCCARKPGAPPSAASPVRRDDGPLDCHLVPPHPPLARRCPASQDVSLGDTRASLATASHGPVSCPAVVTRRRCVWPASSFTTCRRPFRSFHSGCGAWENVPTSCRSERVRGAASRHYPVALLRRRVDFGVRPEVFVATSCSIRSARFTELLSGKARATSGSRRTRLVPDFACL